MWKPTFILGDLLNVDIFRLKFSELDYVTAELLLLNELSSMRVQTKLDHRPVDTRISTLFKVVRGWNFRAILGSSRTNPEET
jgi:hypothetical protein